ncbi:carbohydrate ABC transporter permease [Specibacter sp. AOP5-B1-6]|uniref:carbohydrate ABC transporter permease n=1 Tax=Specibacter sp. AOP5-B1-6 TaxID=3457653 RepID=UPI00402BE09D
MALQLRETKDSPTAKIQRWVDRHLKIIFTMPALLLVLALIIYPLVYTVQLALTDARRSTSRDKNFIGLENFTTLLTDTERFWPAVGRTVYFTGAGLVIETICALGLALLLRKAFRGQGIVRTAILLPLVATPVAVGMMWMLIFQPSIGVANVVVDWFGMPAQGWLSDPDQTLNTLIFMDVWQWTPMMALILLAGLSSIPEEPEEAALVDGASWFQRHIYVTIPMLKPAIFAAILLRAIDSLKTFDILYATKGAGGGSNHEAETLNVLAYSYSFDYQDYGIASAVLILFLILICGAVALVMVSSKAGSK